MFVAASGFGAGSGQAVVHADETISIDVDGITLGRLLRLWDEATGLRSIIPSDVASQKVSVHFSGLHKSDAVRTIFAELPLDYIFVEARGIIVIGPSKAGAAAQPVRAGEPVLRVGSERPLPAQPELPEPPPPPVELRPWPAYLETPFGPVPNTGNPFIHLPPIPGEPYRPFFRPTWPVPHSSAQSNQFGLMPAY
jgi:hypothetical protein